MDKLKKLRRLLKIDKTVFDYIDDYIHSLTKKNSLIKKIYFTFHKKYDNFCYLCNNIKYYILYLPDWLKILWSDRDWSLYFTIRIMDFKLKKLQNYIKNESLLHPSVIKRIDKRVRLCRGYIDHYLNPYKYDNEFFKLPDIEINSKPCDFDKNGKPLLYEMKLVYKSDSHERVSNKRLRESMNKEKEVYNKIFEVIQKYGQDWWY